MTGGGGVTATFSKLENIDVSFVWFKTSLCGFTTMPPALIVDPEDAEEN